MLDRIFKKIIDILYPAKCIFCGELTDTSEVCTDCWEKVFWLPEDSCPICAQPIKYNYAHKCSIAHPFFDRTKAVFAYDTITKVPILNFKNRDATYLATTFANWIYRISQPILESADLIVPVPIHRIKLLRRFYNQAALLAEQLAQKQGLQYLPLALEKHLRTKPQEGLTREQRLHNLEGAFRINTKYISDIKNKNVILIDDVITTGATANECAKVLKQEGGANKVFILAIAKVL